MNVPPNNDFQLWCDAVQNAFAASGAKVSVSQVDVGILSGAFANGASPIIFARNYAASTPPPQAPVATSAPLVHVVPYPNPFLIKVAVHVFVFCGWVSWVVGLGSVAFSLLLIFVSASTKDSGVVAAMVAMTGPPAFLYAFLSLVFGCLCHWLSQVLSLLWHSSRP